VAAALYAVEQGAHLVRVHDVRETVEALTLWQALTNR
jgi:dihydropteroate synthase